jgi:membrane associated rhomboid family serine protease
MGIYDREYYRREGPSFLESISGRAEVCKWLIIINVIVFVLQLLSRDLVTQALILDTRAVWDGQIWRLLTYAFLHDPSNLFHLVFNMLFLWWFGKDMEDLYGPKEFLAFYLMAALMGGLAFQAGWAADAARGRLCLGASGAVTAVMVLYAFHYPTHVIYFFGILPIPIWLFVGFQIAQDLFGVMGGGARDTAYTVHLGGAAFGFAYYKLQWRVMNFWPDLKGWQRRRAQPRLRVYRGEDETRSPEVEQAIEALPMPTPVSVAAPPADSDIDEHLEAKLDAVLAKVAKTGQGSLTDGEKQILMRASEVYKKRRT